LDVKRHVVILLLSLCAAVAAARVRQAPGGVDDVKTFDVVASRFKFEPAIISVGEGDSVRLRVRSVDRAHGIGISAFRVKASIPKAGEVVTVEFTADRPGTFDITCSEYCGGGHAAMKGRLIVRAREKGTRSSPSAARVAE
jgi:cytochrome c oxidase subunit 2